MATQLISQKKEGYRYSLDPFILVSFIKIEKTNTKLNVIDFGTGNGIIPILLLNKYPFIKVTGIEIQWKLALEAYKNTVSNSLTKNINVICGNISVSKKMFKGGIFDMVVGNPPYRRNNDGRINPNIEKAIARHEIKITLSDYISSCSHMLRDKGKVFLIYHPYRLTEMFNFMKQENIQPSVLRFVHSKEGNDAVMVLIEGVKNGNNDLIVQKPFYIYDRYNNYTDEMRKIYIT